MIPALVDVGGPWLVLPAGIHEASLVEIATQYATSERRRTLFEGFVRGFSILRHAGSPAIFLNGRFVSDRPRPSDFVCCWDPQGVDDTKLDPVMLDFSNKRFAQKQKFAGEFFPSTAEAAPGRFFLDYFQEDKHTGAPKGIIRVHE
jgi:hypothetical protein